MKKILPPLLFCLFYFSPIQAQMSNFAWITKGLSFRLPKECEVIVDDSLYFEARKKGFNITLYSFKDKNFNLSNQAEVTQEAAKKVQYDKMEKIDFFYLSNFKCCSIIGNKSNIKIMMLTLLNQKNDQHFTAIIIYTPEMDKEVSELTKSFYRKS